MSTFISRYETSGAGVRLAVKDLIDMAGEVTTAGCMALERLGQVAAADAACLAGARQSGARIVGRTNLHELAFGTTGINPWYGTPVNPVDPKLVPGGSSSGSAVAVATDEADVALGSDTGGSIRIPSACCDTTGLKTTYGRVPLEGVWPLSPSLDTIGPMARDVAGVVTGMQLLEPGFTPDDSAPTVLGRLRRPDVHPDIEAAIDDALARTEVATIDVELPGWDTAVFTGFLPMLLREAWEADKHLAEDDPDNVGVIGRLQQGSNIADEAVAGARALQPQWRAEVDALFGRVELLVLPTLAEPVPEIGPEAEGAHLTALTSAFNYSGHPCLSLPVPGASLQLVGPMGAEELLCAAAARFEAARP